MMKNETKPSADWWKPVAVVLAVFLTLWVVSTALSPFKAQSVNDLPFSTAAAVAKVALEAPMTVDSPRGTSNTLAPAPAATKVVTVARGEGLSQTGSKYGTSTKKMLELNPEYKSHPDFVPLNAQLVVLASAGTSAPDASVHVVNTAYSVPAPKPAAHAAPAPKPAAKPAPKPAAKPATSDYNGAVPVSAWDRLAQCESGGNWSINTGNGFYGGLQFTPSTWRAFGGTGSAQNASKAQQMTVAMATLKVQGWGAWPVCSVKTGVARDYPQYK